MKKIFILLFVLLFAVTLTACNSDKTVEKTRTETKEKTKELVPVDSVTVKDENEEDFIITKDTPFYDALNCFDLIYIENKMIEFDSKIKLGDNDTANVKATYYCINQNAFLWEVKLTEDKKTFTLQEYLKEVHTDALDYTRMTFSKYTYGFNKAFAGQEVVCVEGKVISNDIYSNYNYPMLPPAQTDFGNAHSKANYLIRFFNSFTLLPEFNDFEFNGEKFVVEDYVTRSFELYEDSVIFTQTAPFIMNRFSFSDASKYAFYTGCISDNCEITQTVK